MNAEALLEKYFTNPTALEIILQHSRLVAEKALRIADSLKQREIDRRFIEEAALLHDIGVCRINAPDIGCCGSEPYIRHGIIGKEILEEEGFLRHAMVCERHIGVGLTVGDIREQNLPLPEREMVPISVEEKIVCFADLFFSKKPGFLNHEKPVDVVKKGLGKFGERKVAIFDGWLREFLE
jgi:uncharacterized protein